MKQVIQQLKAARQKALNEVVRLGAALYALHGGRNGNQPKPRKLSKAAREKIAAAQRRRWAKLRREKK